MPINVDKPQLWKADVEKSIDFYNDWFLRFAPETYREQRRVATASVLEAFRETANLTRIVPEVLCETPGLLPILRMVTAPPLARDRLMGLAHVKRALIIALEGSEKTSPRLPKRMPRQALMANLQQLCDVISELVDSDLIPWIASSRSPSRQKLDRAATVVADRMCGAASDPIIRNAQERRQLNTLRRWLQKHAYTEITTQAAKDLLSMPVGTFTFRLSVPAGTDKSTVQIPIDCVVKPHRAKAEDLPVLIEAKSAGDAANTNKRRKEEAQKLHQLKQRYGDNVVFLLYLCGYFEPGYLGYEAAEGIDWVWEHRTGDFKAIFAPPGKERSTTVREASVAYGAATVPELERRRGEAQAAVDASKHAAERNRLGQFSTPFPIASQMVARSLEALPSDVPVAFLEPALGSGVFFSALLRHAPPGRVESATGCEIDPAYGGIAKALWESSGLRVLDGDFVEFASDPDQAGRFSLLCTNPPYVRHHHLQADLKVALQSRVARRLGLRVSGLSGLYVYFVLLADALLADGAVASWLLPAEFLYVNYGRVLREYLTSRVTLLSIHHFDPDEVQFDDALVSSCIVTYRKAPPEDRSTCEMSFGADYVKPSQKRVMTHAELRRLNKWTPSHFENGDPSCETCCLGDLFSVRRGIATGANAFFILAGEQAAQYDIPREFLRPILPSPRFLREPVISSTDDGLPLGAAFRYLLDCPLPPEVVQKRYAGLWAYLQEGVAQGIPEGYLCAQKEVWYFQERREPSRFLASYMGRAIPGRKCPIRFFVNFSSAIVTNVFLNLYPKPELNALLGEDSERALELGRALNQIPAEHVLHAGRAYGGGLHKIEPKELLQVPLVNSPAWLDGVLTRQLALI
jgi:adenine-specific DNA-methyltransferase